MMKPFARKGRKTLYIKFMYASGRRYVDTGETVMYKAERVARQKRDEWIEKYETSAGLTFKQLVAWDLARYSLDKSSTQHFDSSVGLQWRRLQEFFTDPSKITHDSLENYVLWRKGQTRPNGTPAWTMKTLRGHLQTLKRGLLNAKENKGFHGLAVPKNWPVLKVKKKVKGQRGASNDYSTAEMRRMIELLQGHAQDTAIIYAVTGMRAGEGENCRLAHFKARTDMEGCAGTLTIPSGDEDEPRTIAVPLGLLPLLERALPLSLDHKRAFATACLTVTGSRKFGRRDFRAAFISALATVDPYGAHIAAGHLGGVPERYQNWSLDRMAAVAVAAWQALCPLADGGLGSKVVPILGSKPYLRRRVKSQNG